METVEGQELVNRRKATIANRVSVRWKLAVEALDKVGLQRTSHHLMASRHGTDNSGELDRAFTTARSELRRLRLKAINDGAGAEVTGGIQTATDALGALWAVV